MSEDQHFSSNEIASTETNTTNQSDPDRALELAVYSQHDSKKRNALSQKLSMLQKEERALQTLLIRLRSQQSALTIEKIRLNEAHKKITGNEQLNDLNFEDDDDDDEDESESEDENVEENISDEHDNYEITDNSINTFLETEISEYNG